MSQRIPPFNTQNMLSKSSDEILESIQGHSAMYEQGFLSNIIAFIKKDPVLKNYYIRMVYECEAVREIIEKRQTGDAPPWVLSKLNHEFECMKTAANSERIAVYDSEFHNFLFFVAEREGFFNWYNANAKELQDFLDTFWIVNFSKDESREKMISIHAKIVDAISSNDVEIGISAIQEHFSEVILILLENLYNKK